MDRVCSVTPCDRAENLNLTCSPPTKQDRTPSLLSRPSFATSSSPPSARGEQTQNGGIVSLSSLHTLSTACCSSPEAFLTVLPCGHVASLPQETVCHERLWLAGRSAAGIGSPSTGAPQNQSSSKTWHFPRSSALCYMTLFQALCCEGSSLAICSPTVSPPEL